MSAVAPTAFLALWNDVDPALQAEYDDWHAHEHAPERVALPGFVFGRRYVAGTGPEAAPRYFTLYGLESLAALRTDAYAAVVEHPTPWSRRMRGAFRNVSRLACAVAARRGRRAGNALATLVVAAGATPPDRAALDAMAGTAMARHALAAVTIGATDGGPYPLAGALAAQLGPGGSHAVLVEADDAAQAQCALDEIEAAWRASGATVTLRGAHALAQTIAHAAVAPPDGSRRASREELRLRWLRA